MAARKVWTVFGQSRVFRMSMTATYCLARTVFKMMRAIIAQPAAPLMVCYRYTRSYVIHASMSRRVMPGHLLAR